MSLQQTFNPCVIVEFSHTTIYTQMMASYTAAFTPGTQANQSRQAKIYLMFMRAYNFDPYNPSVISLLLYLQVLANSFENITTIKNYLSGAKTHVTKLGGDVSNFSNPQLGTMINLVQLYQDLQQASQPTTQEYTILYYTNKRNHQVVHTCPTPGPPL